MAQSHIFNRVDFGHVSHMDMPHLPVLHRKRTFRRYVLSPVAFFALYVPVGAIIIAALISTLPQFSSVEFWNRLFSAALGGWTGLLLQLGFRRQDRADATRAFQLALLEIHDAVHALTQLCQMDATKTAEALRRNQLADEKRAAAQSAITRATDLAQRHPFLLVDYAKERALLTALTTLLERCEATARFASELDEWLKRCDGAAFGAEHPARALLS